MNIYTQGNCWPTHSQKLLLEAGLKDPERARDAWKEYCQLINLKKTEDVSPCFFPLVFKNLAGCKSAELDICKSMYNHTWSSNHLLLFEVKPALEKLHLASIQACLLKGSALIAFYYKDIALRTLGDIDILIPQDRISDALQIFEETGFHAEDQDIRFSHALFLKNKNNRVIDLHWNVLTESWMDVRLQKFSFRTQPSTLVPTAQIFGPEDLLLHTLFHSVRHAVTPLIRWIPDATHILKQSPHFDWDYFIHQAQCIEIKSLVHAALTYLHQHQFAFIPDHAFQGLHSWIRRDQKYFQFLLCDPKKPASGLKLYWYIHARNSCSENIFHLLRTFPAFIKNTRQFKNWFQLAYFLIERLFVNCGRVFVWPFRQLFPKNMH